MRAPPAPHLAACVTSPAPASTDNPAMTSKYVIPADTQQWLSGIGARLPRSENHAADQLAASDHHTCEDGEQAAVVDLDDHDVG